MRVVIGRLAEYAQNGPNNKYSRFAWVMQGVTDEILDELAETEQDAIGEWFEQFGKIIEWCGSGDDSVLPDAVRPYLQQKERERLAITAGN